MSRLKGEGQREAIPDTLSPQVRAPLPVRVRTLLHVEDNPTMPNDAKKGLAAGFFRYLTKPIKVPKFMDTLDVALKHGEDNAAQSSSEAIA